MKAVAAAISAMKRFDGSVVVEGVELSVEDVLVTRTPKKGLVVASAGQVVVGLDTTLDEALVMEGNAREFVSHVQAMRKEADFEVVQRIALSVETDAEMERAIKAHIDYVKNETLSLSVEFGAADGAAQTELNGHAAKILVRKA